ncbi:MAG TPA: hypothetical protein ENJ43_01475 [Gammaproteobacteria bacterium]|nr:hypothetical protein [Gammaproteobacteria bacterium]
MPRTLPAPPAPLAALLMALLAGCQSGGSSPDSEAGVWKDLSPVIADVVQESRATEGYVSYHVEDGTYYRAVPGFLWQAPLSRARSGSATLSDYQYAGFAMQIDTDESTPDLAQICNSSVYIALYPPAATLTASGAQFDPENGLGNEALSRVDDGCGNDYFRLRALDDDGDGTWDRFRYSFPPGGNSSGLLNRAVAGSWQLRDTAGTVASFELPALDPEKVAQQLPWPVPTLNYDSSTGLLESIDIQWYEADSPEPVTGNDMVKRSVVALLDRGTDVELREQYEAYGLARQAVFPDYPWRIEQAEADDPRITTLQISYEIEGVAYRFTWQE